MHPRPIDRTRSERLACAGLLLTTLLAPATLAADFADEGHCQFRRWEPVVSEEFDESGGRVATAGDVAAVACYGENVASQEFVDLYHLEDGIWSFTQRLDAPPGAEDSNFGSALHLREDQLLVGAHLCDLFGQNAGAVFVYDRTPGGWVLGQTLSSVIPQDNAGFGTYIDRDGPLTAIGAPGFGISPAPDAVEIFSGPFNVIQRIDPEPGETLGGSIALSGSTLLVGAPYDDDITTNGGAVYHHEVTPYDAFFVEKLQAPDTALGAEFGWKLAADGETVAITAVRDPEASFQAGAVYVYEIVPSGDGSNSVVYSDKVAPSGLEPEARFGWSIDVRGNRLAVGARAEADERGTVYVFRKSFIPYGWLPESELVAEEAMPGDEFGTTVALMEDHVLAGAPFSGKAGGACLFALGPSTPGGGYCPCETAASDVLYGDAKAGQIGAPTLDGLEPPTVGEFTRVSIQNVLPGAAGFLLVGFATAEVPFDLGALYVADPILVSLLPAPPWGTITLSYTLPDEPALCGVQLAHQAVFFDPAAPGPVGTAQTNGLVRTIGY